MADESYRKYRPADRAWPGEEPASEREVAPDPLVELARLIGQNDPFAFDSGRGASRRALADQAPAEPYPAGAAYAPARHEQRVPQDDEPDQRSGRWPPVTAYDHGDGGSYSAARHPAEAGGEQYPGDAGDPARADESDGYDDQYARGYERDGYDDAEDDDDERAAYDEPSRRRRIFVAAAVLALAVIGTAGAFGYRSMSAGAPKAPPVIKADNSPNKVASATQAGDSANKQIYERLGERSQGERVVPREEQPVDIRDTAPRVLVPAIPPAEAAPAAPASPPTAATATATRPASEPKKIRTVTIRPDQASPDAQPARPAPPAPAAAARSAAPARPIGNAPLSLNPGAEPAPAPAPPRTVPAHTATASPPPRAAESGNYVVQLSAQKSESEAQASFRAMQAKYPSVLSGRQPLIRKKDLGSKGIYYGAQVGPFASREQAVQLCEDLKAAGGNCIVQRN